MKKRNILTSAVIAASVCLTMTACGTTRLDPEEFCDVEVVGANGYGKVRLEPDYDDLEDEIVDCLGDDSTKKERQAAAEFARKIKFEVVSDNEENLSNGDVVEIGVKYDEDDALKDFKFKFKTETFKYKVDDLDDADVIDPFDGLEIEYSGFSPRGKYKISNGKCDPLAKKYFTYEVIDAPEGVSNGDKLTIKANCEFPDNLLDEGYVVASETKEYTVSGLEEGKALDPFDKIIIEYKGISPRAEAYIDTTNCDDYIKNNVTYRIDNNGSIANGENFTITVRYDESKAEQNGVVITAEEKTITAEGVPYYLNSLENCDLSSLDSEYRDYAEQKAANDNWYKGSENKNISWLTSDSYCQYLVKDFKIVPVKRILLIPKNIQNNSTKSWYAVVYRMDGTFEKTKKDSWCKCDIDKGTTVNSSYYFICYSKNMAVNSDGSINNESRSGLSYEFYWPKDYENLSLDSICEKWRTQNISDFNVTIADVE